MSVTPNLCYDETEPRSIHSPDSSKVRVKVSQPCLILCDPMDCSPPGSSVHGILQASILCHFLFQGIFPTQGSNTGLLHYRHIFLPSEPPWKLKASSQRHLTCILEGDHMYSDRIGKEDNFLVLRWKERGNKLVRIKKGGRPRIPLSGQSKSKARAPAKMEQGWSEWVYFLS